jgi:hypothetical protein
MQQIKEAEATLYRLDEIMDAIRKLQDEHKLLEVRLDHYNRKVYLSPQEEFDRKEIQKLKLRTKDRISWLERRFIRA